MIALAVLLPIFGYATIFNIYFTRRISVSIFFSITFVITLLFTFGMLDFLQYGTYGLFYGGIGLLVYTAIKETKKVLDSFLTVPVIMFTVMSIIYLYFMQDAKLFFWDEYSHWGIFIKEMYYFNHFYDASSVAAHLNYPPGISIWDYFIVSFTGYREGSLYFAYFLILFSSTLMMYEKLSFRQMHWIVLIFMIQMVVFSGFGHWFSCIYVDHVIGAIFAGLVMTYLSDSFKGKEFLLFIFPMISIVLVKEIGLYFGMASLGLIFLLQIARNKLEDDKWFRSSIKAQKQVIAILFILAVSMVLVLKVWGMRQESVGVEKEQQSISGIVKSTFSDTKVLSEGIEAEVKRRFWEVVVYQQLHKEKMSLNYNEFSYAIMPKYTSVIRLSALGSLLFFIFICLMVYLSIESRDKRTEIRILGTYMVFISVIYIFILYFSYLVAFGQGALRLPSYVRYVNMAILPLFFIGFSLFLPLYYSTEKKEVKSKLFVVALGVIVILSFIVKPYFKPLYSQLENGFMGKVDKATDNILKVIPYKSTVFVVFPVKNNGSLNIMLKYSLIPARARISTNDFSKKTSKGMRKVFSQYEYVWFAAFNQELVNKNTYFLKQKKKNQLYTLYKIEKKNDVVSFIPVQ